MPSPAKHFKVWLQPINTNCARTRMFNQGF
jgi:hypothetical protein